MDRKHASVVVEADDGVDVTAGEEQAAQPRAAVIGGETRRQHETEASAVAGERHGSLGEQLVAIEMPRGLRSVDGRRRV